MRVSPTLAPTSAASISGTRRPDPSSTTVSDWPVAVRAGEVDDDRVALLRRPVVGGHELGDRAAQRVDLRLDELLRDDRLRARHLERRPVDDLRGRLHLDGRAEGPRLRLAGRQLEVVLGCRDGAQARAGGGVPEPAADVRLDRLDPEPVAADVREQHLPRHLALAEAGDLDRAGEVGGRVLDRVLELVRRDVDREADAVPAELLHLGHARIQAVAARLAGDMPRWRLRVRGARAATRALPAHGAR